MGRRSIHGQRRCEECGCVIEKGYKCEPCEESGQEYSRQAYYGKRRLQYRASRKVDPVREKQIERDLAVTELRPWLECFVEVGQSGPCRSLQGSEFAEMAAHYQKRDARKSTQNMIYPYAVRIGK